MKRFIAAFSGPSRRVRVLYDPQALDYACEVHERETRRPELDAFTDDESEALALGETLAKG